MVEVVVDEISARAGALDVTSGGAGWKPAVRQRILSAREVLLRHPWAPGLIESRTTMSPAVLRYYDSLAGLLRKGGFSVDLAHHAMHALGSRALGFTQELFAEENNADVGPEVAAIMVGQLAKEYPHISAIVMGASHDAESTLGWCDDQVEFEFGLDLILDGLDRLRDTGAK
jgi:Tetracyclin repressor-like, C-terminal domain